MDCLCNNTYFRRSKLKTKDGYGASKERRVGRRKRRSERWPDAPSRAAAAEARGGDRR
ncbi:hypothetical protein A2U01_0065591 [Trifolium medium]|uniref:Uncharacterized protein n=1 Tax=Trifolium medium TaxID=97028 RepID=A0A392S7D2_9FABA|nr:hypothetical protein [Trifolium medium]